MQISQKRRVNWVSLENWLLKGFAGINMPESVENDYAAIVMGLTGYNKGCVSVKTQPLIICNFIFC